MNRDIPGSKSCFQHIKVCLYTKVGRGITTTEEKKYYRRKNDIERLSGIRKRPTTDYHNNDGKEKYQSRHFCDSMLLEIARRFIRYKKITIRYDTMR